MYVYNIIQNKLALLFVLLVQKQKHANWSDDDIKTQKTFRFQFITKNVNK